MNFIDAIAPYSSNVLSYHLVNHLLKDYKRPNDKISELLQNGSLISLKKGLYIAGEAIKTAQPEPLLIANHLLGPSYVSLDTALSWYGFIPERVYTISSITTKASRTFNNPVGIFEFIHQSTPYYSLGINQIQLTDNQYVMMASPEKALIDKVVTTTSINFHSKKDVYEYLVENLRIDKEELQKLDIAKMITWLDITPKRNSIVLLLKTLENL